LSVNDGAEAGASAGAGSTFIVKIQNPKSKFPNSIYLKKIKIYTLDNHTKCTHMHEYLSSHQKPLPHW
jgi:hypothetical protein